LKLQATDAKSFVLSIWRRDQALRFIVSLARWLRVSCHSRVQARRSAAVYWQCFRNHKVEAKGALARIDVGRRIKEMTRYVMIPRVIVYKIISDKAVV
jgi:hypothetical protein